jgi:hypothetical protein
VNAQVRAGAHPGERNQPTQTQSSAMEKDFRDRLNHMRTSGAVAAAAAITVRVHFHVITNGTVGNVSDTTLGRQLTVLDQSFASSGVTFRLAEGTQHLPRRGRRPDPQLHGLLLRLMHVRVHAGTDHSYAAAAGGLPRLTP